MAAMTPFFQMINSLEGFELVCFCLAALVGFALTEFLADWLLGRQGFGPYVNSALALIGVCARTLCAVQFSYCHYARYEPYFELRCAVLRASPPDPDLELPENAGILTPRDSTPSIEARVAGRLFLARRTIERRAGRLHDPGDRPRQRGRGQRAFAAVDHEGVLEIAEFAVGLAMVAQGRAARRDRLFENARIAFASASRPRSAAGPVGERARLALRRKARRDAALRRRRCCQAGDPALVEQRGSSAAPRPASSRASARRRRNRGESGSTPRPRNSGCSASPPSAASVIRAEAARVVVDDARAALEREARHGRARRFRSLEM